MYFLTHLNTYSVASESLVPEPIVNKNYIAVEQSKLQWTEYNWTNKLHIFNITYKKQEKNNGSNNACIFLQKWKEVRAAPKIVRTNTLLKVV